MSLKFKRNYPTILLLVGILSLLAVTMGNQPVVAYTINIGTIQMQLASAFGAKVPAGIVQPGLPAASAASLTASQGETQDAIFDLFGSFEN
ncbi:MAG: hypothetical protein ACOYYU_05125 [Chloroflexota bacterium]